ncbi:MAG: glycosyltransferase family 4 protein [Gemmobacter sp.]
MTGGIGILPVMAGRSGGGPETYERALVHGLARLDPGQRYEVLCLNAAAARVLSPGGNVRTTVLPGHFRPVAMTAGLAWGLWRRKVDFLHAAYIAPPVSPVPYVFTLHCSSPFMRPDFFPPAIRRRLLFLLARGMRDARHVIAVSQNVKDYAVAHYRADPGRITVVHNGVGAHFRPVPPAAAAPVLARHGLPARFVFCAARFEKRKNLDGALRAFAHLHRADPGLRLVIAGDMSWEKARLDGVIDALGLRGAVVLTGYIPNEDLPAVYSACLFFAYPSLWEGFGIPVLEAMACGAPVLSSAVTSIPEVAGDAALLVDPASDDALRAGFLALGTDAGLRARLAAAGPVRAALFGWDRCAAQTLAVYRRFA